MCKVTQVEITRSDRTGSLDFLTASDKVVSVGIRRKPTVGTHRIRSYPRGRMGVIFSFRIIGDMLISEYCDKVLK